MKRTLFIILFILTTLPLCHAQRQPTWMNELPRAGNSTILYVCESGEGSTLTDATNQAIARVMQNTAMRLGQPFDAQQVNKSLQNGTSVEVLSRQYNIPIRKVDDYATRLRDGTYRVWVLCQVAATGNLQPQWEEMRRTGEVSNGMALLKSVFIPGLGQMGKGYVGEGIATLTAEVALVGVGVGCYYLAQDDLNTMRSARVSYADFDAAQQRYNTLRTTSYIAWGTAGALYLFNLARATFAQPRIKRDVAFVPSLISSPNGLTPAISFTLNL